MDAVTFALSGGKAGRMTNQQAINVLKDLEQCLDDYCELNDEWKAAFSKVITALELFGNTEQLPSAQPDIIRCKDCKHWERESICDGYCSEIEKCGFDEDHFCGYAERREE